MITLPNWVTFVVCPFELEIICRFVCLLGDGMFYYILRKRFISYLKNVIFV